MIDKTSFKKNLIEFSLLFWAIIFFFVFIFLLPSMRVIFVNLASLFVSMGIFLAAYLIGRFLLRLFSLHCFLSLIEETVLSIGIGLGFCSYAVFILGTLGFLSPIILYLLIGLGLVLNIGEIGPILKKEIKVETKKEGERASIFQWVIRVIVILSFVLGFFLALSPPKFYDVLDYHLGVPHQYILAGKIGYLPYSAISNYPLLIQMLYTLALIVKGGIAAKLTNYLIGVSAILTLYAIGKRFFKTPSPILASAILASSPAFIELLAVPTADLGFLFYTLLFLLLLLLWWDKGGRSLLILAGVIAGLSLGTKYTAILYSLGLGGAFVFIKSTRRRLLRGGLLHLLVFAGIAIAIFSPWLIRNYLYTKNPIFPAGTTYFGGINWSPAHEKQLTETTRNKVVSTGSPLSIILLPLDLTLHSERFGTIGSNPGLVFLIFLPLLIFLHLKKNWVSPLLVLYTGGYFTIWIVSFQQTRFALPAFAALALVLSSQLSEVMGYHFGRITPLLRLLLVGAMILGVPLLLSSHIKVFDPIPYILGLEDETHYLERAIPSYPAMRYINEKLPGEGKVLFVGETRSYYLNHPLICVSAYNTHPLSKIVREAKDGKEIREKLREMGVRYILFNQRETGRLDSNFPLHFQFSRFDKMKFSIFLNDETSVLFHANDVFVLRIKD
jgi:hypothetical protein